jgi:homoserine kinase
MSGEPVGKKFGLVVSVEFRALYRMMKDEQMKRSIDSLADALEQRPLDAGAFVPKDRWPDEYRTMGLSNVYKANLTKGARITYTVTLSQAGSGLVRVIEFFPTHKDYAKKFGYGV